MAKLKKVGKLCPHKMKEFIGTVEATEEGYLDERRVQPGEKFEHHGYILESVDVEVGEKINGWMRCLEDKTPKPKKAAAKKPAQAASTVAD